LGATMTIYLSLLVAIVGGLAYLLITTNTKAAELGKIMFGAGLLAFLLQFTPTVVGALR